MYQRLILVQKVDLVPKVDIGIEGIWYRRLILVSKVDIGTEGWLILVPKVDIG